MIPRTPVYGIKVDVEHFVMRLLQDCIDQATVSYWLRRANDFDDCNPFIAQQCRRHAWLLSQNDSDEISPEVLSVLSEAS